MPENQRQGQNVLLSPPQKVKVHIGWGLTSKVFR